MEPTNRTDALERNPLRLYKPGVKLDRACQMRREMTDAERRLWARLRANRFMNLHFRKQQPIAGFIADFYCHACRLVIEVDGQQHERQKEYDFSGMRYWSTMVYAYSALRILK